MSVVIRGCRNALRNKTRTVAVVLVLAVAVGLTLSMLVANEAVKGKLAALRAGMDTTISARPGFPADMKDMDDMTMLSQAQLEAAREVADIDQVSAYLSGMLESPDNGEEPQEGGPRIAMAGGGVSGETDLVSGVDPEEMGAPEGMQFPVPVNGVGADFDQDGRPFTLVDGEMPDLDGTGSALVSDQIAEANDLAVGDTFTAFEETFTVSGIAETAEFDNVGVVIPVAELQDLSGETGYSSFTAVADDVDNLEAATEALAEELGKAVEVTSSADTALEASKGLETVEGISWIGFLVSLLCATVIVFFTLAMTVRERRKEVGVLKAIGGTNRGVITQFGAEAVTLVVLGAILGLGVAAGSSNVMADVLVATNTPAAEEGGDGMSVGGATVSATRVTVGGPGSAESASELIGDITASVGLETLGLGLFVAVAIAVLGSVVPTWLIARVRPAEVLRGE